MQIGLYKGHFDDKTILTWLHSSNQSETEREVFDHLCRCATCGDRAANFAGFIVLMTGVDPYTGNKVTVTQDDFLDGVYVGQ